MERYQDDRPEESVQCQLAGRVLDLRLLLRDDGLVLQGLCHSHHARQSARRLVVAGTRPPLPVRDIKVLR